MFKTPSTVSDNKTIYHIKQNLIQYISFKFIPLMKMKGILSIDEDKIERKELVIINDQVLEIFTVLSFIW